MTGMAGAMGGGASMTMGPGAAGALRAGAGGMGCAMGAGGMGGAVSMTGMGGMGMPGQHEPMGDGAAPAGYGPAGNAHGGGLFDSMGMGGDLFSNSEFELNRESRGGIFCFWSRSSRSHFTGVEDALSLNGDVRTTMFGADYARGPLTRGLSVGRTLGMGLRACDVAVVRLDSTPSSPLGLTARVAPSWGRPGAGRGRGAVGQPDGLRHGLAPDARGRRAGRRGGGLRAAGGGALRGDRGSA